MHFPQWFLNCFTIMSGCCAYGCTNRSERQMPGITFHLFPRDPVRRKAWTLAVKRKNFRPNNFTRICSEHFAEECFIRISSKKTRLHPKAVPTIFKAYPKNLQNISSLAPLTDFYSNKDIIIKKEASDSDEVVEDEQEEEDSMSESSEPSLCGEPPETEVVYVSEEYEDDSDQPNLKIIPESPPKSDKVMLDKNVMHALYSFSKLQSTSALDDLKQETVSLVLVQPPPKDSESILTPQELANMDPDTLRNLCENNKREIKALRQKSRRYKEKIAKLEKIIENFRTYKTSDEEDGNALSEDNISVDEIYEQLLKNQEDDYVDSESS